MVWGTGAARRRHEQDFAACDAIPQTAECARCEASAILVDGQLPRDWLVVDGGAICGDCAEATTRPAPPLPTAAPPLRQVEDGVHHSSRHGCRVGHEVALGMAAIQIRGGARPPEGRDEAVNFLMGPAGLDQLIIELGVIRAEIVASETPGTRLREYDEDVHNG